MKHIFINLPVKDVNKSMEFYRQLGFTINPLFTFDDQKCLNWGDSIFIMLQSQLMFGSGIKKDLADPNKSVTATFTLPLESIEALNNLVENAVRAGGIEIKPAINEGFMILRNIQDLDGHNWGVIHLDLEKFKAMKGR